MKKKKIALSCALLAAATVVAASTAGAGAKSSSGVGIVAAQRWAYGHVGDVYNSTDPVEMIYCEARGYATYTHGYCFARTWSGITGQCNTMAEPVIRAIQAIGPETAIEFRWDLAGNCTAVIARNGSMYAPKTP